jgi:hypothetical protein
MDPALAKSGARFGLICLENALRGMLERQNEILATGVAEIAYGSPECL